MSYCWYIMIRRLVKLLLTFLCLCFESQNALKTWLKNDWDCVGIVTDSYYEFSNSSHAALDIRNGFSHVTVLPPLIIWSMIRRRKKWTEGSLNCFLSSAMGTGLITSSSSYSQIPGNLLNLERSYRASVM